MFQKASFRADAINFSGLVPLYACITPLRFLCLRESRPDDWDVANRFMDHNEDRERTDAKSWRIHELLVFNFISVVLKMAETFSKAEIRKSKMTRIIPKRQESWYTGTHDRKQLQCHSK